MALYFVVFFTVGSFFFLDPCIGALIDNCYRMRNAANAQHQLQACLPPAWPE